jgi:hypothetical protein
MKETNETKELIDEVLKVNLKQSLEDSNLERAERALDNAILLIDKKIEINKVELEVEKANSSTKSDKKNRVLKVLEVVAVPVAIVVINHVFDYRTKVSCIDMISKYERSDTYTSTPGRSLSQLFKWR